MKNRLIVEDSLIAGGGSHARRTRAFMAVDMLFGIIIVGSVALVLLKIVTRAKSADTSLADARAALHAAEHALLNLQHGQPPPADFAITIHPTATGKAPAGFTWVKATATVQGHTQSLIGIVPVGAVK